MARRPEKGLTELLKRLVQKTSGEVSFVARDLLNDKSNFQKDTVSRFIVAVQRRQLTPIDVAVSFDRLHLSEAPDVVVLGGAGFPLVLNDVPSLVKWDPTNDDSLVNVLLEINKAYAEAQRSLALNYNNEHIRFQLQTFSLNNVEFEVRQEKNGVVVIVMLIPIDISASTPEKDEYAYVRVEFMAYEGETEHANHTVSHVLGQLTMLRLANAKLPTLLASDSLLDFVERFTVTINDEINKYNLSLHARQQVISALLTEFGAKTVAELDTKEFMSVSFLCNTIKTPVLIIIRFSKDNGNSGPRPYALIHSPVFNLKGSLNENAALATREFELPFSPRWDKAEVVARFLPKIQQELWQMVGEKNLQLQEPQQSAE